MATEINSYIDELGMDMEEFYRLSEDERVATYENAINDMTDEELTEFEAALKETMDYLYEEYAVQVAELEQIIDSGSSSTEEIARAEIYLEEIEAMEDTAHEFSSEFGKAQSNLADHNVETSTDYTVDAGSDVQSGEEFVIDCTGATETETTADWAEDDHPDWLDTNDDGIGDLDPDADDDGYADEDFNDDGIITESDMERDSTTDTPQTITITVEATDTVTVSSYDSETGTVRFAITKEDGTVYYVTVKSVAGALPNIKFTNGSSLHSDDFETLDSELVNRIYTDISSEYSLAHYLGMEENEESNKYTFIDLADFENEYEETISTTDISGEREYYFDIPTSSSEAVNLTLNVPDDVTIDFEAGENGYLDIILTDSSGNTVTIHVLMNDAWLNLSINGGNLDDDAIENLEEAYDTIITNETIFSYYQDDVLTSSKTAI
jgi:hypothetical protein